MMLRHLIGTTAMPTLNKVQLIGHVTHEPELRYTTKGSAVVDIDLAISRQFVEASGEKKEELSVVEATFWGRQAEALAKHAKKSSLLYLEGRLQLDAWEDKATGDKRTRLRVIGESFQFLDKRPQPEPAAGEVEWTPDQG
jgi:single-strand DNA-binding protein